MNELDFSFEYSRWEAYLNSARSSGIVNAAALLSMLEGEDPSAVEEAFSVITEDALEIDMTGFPKDMSSGQTAVRLREEAEFAAKGLRIESLAEQDPLRLYLEELSAVPAFGDERLLAEKSAAGDENARIQLTNLGLGAVVQMAAAFTGYGVLLTDLIQEGSLGLWEGIQQYTAGDYVQHRDRCIRSAIIKAVILQATDSGLGRKMRTAMQDYRQVDERLLTELGRNPTIEEIASEMHLTPSETEAVKKMLDSAYLLQQARGPEKEEPSPEDTQAVEDTAYFQMRQRIQELLSVLPEDQAQILSLRYGLEGGLPLTPEETGKRLNLTAGEVIAKEMSALALLRKES